MRSRPLHLVSRMTSLVAVLQLQFSCPQMFVCERKCQKGEERKGLMEQSDHMEEKASSANLV